MIITEPCPPPNWDDCETENVLGGNEATDHHSASLVALAERIAYLMTAALDPSSLRSPAEQTRLRRLGRELGLPEHETRRVLAAICEADSTSCVADHGALETIE